MLTSAQQVSWRTETGSLSRSANSDVVFNIAGQYFAIGDVCSHDGGPLGDGELEDQQIICPRHGARFDVRTGTVLTLPAFEDIPAFPVIVENDRLKIGVPLE
jgi:3-phenylpropionate/trans-cinnamate dioxygenase ferredoxin component